jgi:hypothetical protein
MSAVEGAGRHGTLGIGQALVEKNGNARAAALPFASLPECKPKAASW